MIYKLTFRACFAGMLCTLVAAYLGDISANQLCALVMFFSGAGCFSIVKGVNND